MQAEAKKSFMSLLKVHDNLDEIFISHQISLLELNLEKAKEFLGEFERMIKIHMQHEDALFPVFQRAGKIEGGGEELFVGEHKKMLEFLARFKEAINKLNVTSPTIKKEIIKFLDDEALFKHLVEHHSLREENVLYPVLDKVTTPEEREKLLNWCVTKKENDETKLSARLFGEITPEQVKESLRQVIDPELGVNIVDLGLVYSVEIQNRNVHITMTMTSPACPLNAQITDMARSAIKLNIPSIESVNIELVWKPKWEPTMMSENARQKLGWMK
ncbi:DUF59 domain-containing protein [Candidatus Peregrinibacteria bacterium]|nr:DUF59 domain-containing protein [Candidatus Peregrinibacteria bacterium]